MCVVEVEFDSGNGTVLVMELRWSLWSWLGSMRSMRTLVGIKFWLESSVLVEVVMARKRRVDGQTQFTSMTDQWQDSVLMDFFSGTIPRVFDFGHAADVDPCFADQVSAGFDNQTRLAEPSIVLPFFDQRTQLQRQRR